MKLLIIYIYCTFGGVERVILNRVEAFRNFGIDIKIDMVFLHDAGGLESFKKNIDSFDLSKYIKVHILNDDFSRLRINNYDMVLNIDTFIVFEKLKECKNLYVECHTSYKENRRYISSLPGNVKAILVPSESFRNKIRDEVPKSKNIFVLPNTVSEVFFNDYSIEKKTFFKKRIIAYFGRLDELKNIEEALEIFKEFRDRDDIMYMIIGHGVVDECFIKKLRKLKLLNKTFIRSKIHFDKVPQFLSLLKTHKGVLLSPSKAESFAMSIAESIASSIPVIVSDIPSHRDLLGSNRDFLYSLANIREAKEKINNILENWNNYSNIIKTYAKPLRHISFIEAWKNFVSSYH